MPSPTVGMSAPVFSFTVVAMSSEDEQSLQDVLRVERHQAERAEPVPVLYAHPERGALVSMKMPFYSWSDRAPPSLDGPPAAVSPRRDSHSWLCGVSTLGFRSVQVVGEVVVIFFFFF